jgi:glycosyltransferase involved in cell wall biosynthesis
VISVTVVIPTFNRRDVVDRALDSVQNQTRRADEVIVVDDGSTDGTSNWIAKDRPEVRLITLPQNEGAAHARNVAMRAATGDVFAFLDSDDWWDPRYLECTIAALEANQDAAIAVSDVNMLLHGSTQPYIHLCRPNARYSDLTEHLLVDGFIPTMSCVAVRRGSAERAGSLREDLKVVHDSEWYLRLVRHGGITATREALVWRVFRQDNLVSNIDAYRQDALGMLKGFFESEEGREYGHVRWKVMKKTHRAFGDMGRDGGRVGSAIWNYVEAAWCGLRAGESSTVDLRSAGRVVWSTSRKSLGRLLRRNRHA